MPPITLGLSPGPGPAPLAPPPHLQRLSGISSRLLLAAMNSSRLASLPMPEGSPSKSRRFEFRYSFFSLVSLQMADWRENRRVVRGGRRGPGASPARPGETHRQRGELVAGQVQGLHVHPLVDAQGQLGDLVAAEVETAQAGEGVQALGHPRQVVAGQVHVWAQGGAPQPGPTRTAPEAASPGLTPGPTPLGSMAFGK